MLELTEANKRQWKKTLSLLLDIRSRKKAVTVFCILFCTTFFLYKILLYDVYMMKKVCAKLPHPPIRGDKRINTTKSDTTGKYIKRTPGYRYHDNDLLSPQNNVYLSRYNIHYCKIDKNMGSTMQVRYVFDHRLIHDLLLSLAIKVSS